MTAPAVVGERVRCTLGDNVIVGIFHGTYGSGRTVEVVVNDRICSLAGGWTVEVLDVPEPPVGTVVVDREGDAWQRRPHGWQSACPAFTAPTFDKLEAEWGPLTVLAVEHVR